MSCAPMSDDNDKIKEAPVIIGTVQCYEGGIKIFERKVIRTGRTSLNKAVSWRLWDDKGKQHLVPVSSCYFHYAVK